MSEQELDLLEIATGFAAELGAGAAEIVCAEVLDTDLARGLLDDGPDGPVAEALADLAALADLPQQRPVLDRGRRLPGIDGVLQPQGDGNRADAATLAAEVAKFNAIWQADHAQLDIQLVCEGGTTARPWLTVMIDDYSRAIAGYYLGFEAPSSLRTSLALRQGIWRKGDPHWHICGIPEVLYTDNGCDFTSRHIEQVAAELRMRLVFSTPGKPQGRGRIERFFRTVNEMFLCDLDGYTRRSRRSASLSIDQLEALFRSWLLETYHRRPSSEGRLCPKERWDEGGFLPRMPD